MLILENNKKNLKKIIIQNYKQYNFTVMGNSGNSVGSGERE